LGLLAEDFAAPLTTQPGRIDFEDGLGGAVAKRYGKRNAVVVALLPIVRRSRCEPYAECYVIAALVGWHGGSWSIASAPAGFQGKPQWLKQMRAAPLSTSDRPTTPGSLVRRTAGAMRIGAL
jgi:hypothetical protein